MMSIQVGLVAIFVISKVPEKFLSSYELLHYSISKESAYIQYTGWTVECSEKDQNCKLQLQYYSDIFL